MKKLKGYENHYYSERWEHKGVQVCTLTDRTYLIFDREGNEVIKRCSTLEEAEEYINLNY